MKNCNIQGISTIYPASPSALYYTKLFQILITPSTSHNNYIYFLDDMMTRNIII